ncbi:hypothetical protein QOZ80_7AG0575220 [Eleusine coracana subsp. coracana]|nr:hypothetical protein QOZ80_7AG0575220 [Eleusine coracana subsp. coracana]
MDAAAAAARGSTTNVEEEEEKVRLLTSVRNHLLLIYVGTMVVTLAPRLAADLFPRAVAAASRAISSSAACTAAATVLVQARLARVLERRPALRLTAKAAWPLALCTWLFVTIFVLEFLRFAGGGALIVGRADWAVVAVASGVNLVMAVHTVARHLA